MNIITPQLLHPSLLPSEVSRGSNAPLAPQITSLELPHNLVRAIELILHGAAHPQRRNGGPHAALPAQHPVIQGVASGRLEQADKVARRDLGHQRHGRGGHLLVDEEPADASREEAQGVELAQAVADLEPDHAHEKRRQLRRLAARLDQRRAVHV